MRKAQHLFAWIAVIFLTLTAVLSCGNGNQNHILLSAVQPTGDRVFMNQSSVEWPTSLPSDKAQPWETVDGAGRVVSSINLQSQFVPGVERFLEAGNVSDFGEASRMASGVPEARACPGQSTASLWARNSREPSPLT